MTPTAGAVPPNSPAPAIDDPALNATYRKVAWRLLPFLMALWILAWIDRVNIGFAKLQMLSELRFSETVYGLGAGIFFLGYFLFEVPSNLLLERIGAKRTIARITVLWGITCIAMMWVTTPLMFYILRFLLGVFEAGFYPGVILYLTYWFPTGRRAKAFGLFMSASAFAGVIGGPMAGNLMTGLQGVNGWSGWQWVFLIEGIPSVIAGIVTLLYLTDRPEEAGHWLDQNERQMLIADLARDRGALSGREHNMFAAFGKRPHVAIRGHLLLHYHGELRADVLRPHHRPGSGLQEPGGCRLDHVRHLSVRRGRDDPQRLALRS